MIALVRHVLAALKLQTEVGLNYLLGRFPNRYEEKMAWAPALPLVGHAVYAVGWAIKRCCGVRRASVRRSDYLIYVGSVNQGESLISTITALRKRGCVCTVLARSDSLIQTKTTKIVFPLVAVLAGAIAMLNRLPQVARDVSAISNSLYKRRLYTFLLTYFWAAYFCWAICRSRPRGILMSNDHSLPNRCLLYSAKVLGVKTFYLQHASVSEAFPPLEFDVAFLDGRVAAETYGKCGAPLSARSLTPCKVFLTGNKKGVSKVATGNSCAGLAVNILDQPCSVLNAATAILALGLKVKVRLHPAMGEAWRSEFANLVRDKHNINLCPNGEALQDFLVGLSCLVAGSSSIHLEAALAGVMPIYYEMGEYDDADYYGYVRNGLSRLASNQEELVALVAMAATGEARVELESVRAYSHTFHTRWEGREGELVARLMMRYH